MPEKPDADSDESSVFDAVKHHPRVCQHCFRLRHHETPVPHRVRALASRTYWADAVTPSWTRTQHVDHDASPLARETVADRTPRTVCDCGCVSAHTETRRGADGDGLLDLETVIEFTKHLSATLEALADEHRAQGDLRAAARFAHDDDVLFGVVRHLKTHPDRQCVDAHIFRAAVELACDRGPDVDDLELARDRAAAREAAAD